MKFRNKEYHDIPSGSGDPVTKIKVCQVDSHLHLAYPSAIGKNKQTKTKNIMINKDSSLHSH